MIICEKVKDLEVAIRFNSNYTNSGIEDVLSLLEAEVSYKLNDFEYLVNIYPLDYSKLSTLSTVDYTIITKPLDYGGY